jgi:hypothetical protein
MTVEDNKILYVTRFWVNWAFLIALEVLKPSLRSCFNLVAPAIRKTQFTRCINTITNVNFYELISIF